MRASAFPAYARAASNLLFALAAVAALLGITFILLYLADDDALLIIVYGDSVRGGIVATLLLLGQWVLMAVLVALAGLGLRLVAAFAEEVADGSALLTEALSQREQSE